MEILRIVFLLFVAAFLACLAILIIFIDKAIAKKRKDIIYGKHFCNDCECGFIRRGELDFIYCPFCGKKLTQHAVYLTGNEETEDNPFTDFEK